MIQYKTYGDLNGLHIRPMTPEDIPQITIWMNDPAMQETFTNQPNAFTEEPLRKDLEKMTTKDKPGRILYCIYLGDILIGMTSLRRVNWEALNASTSTFIAPNPEFRGKGYGHRAAELRVDLARDLGLKTVYARIHEDNIPNVKIHEKVGFKLVGRLSDYTLSGNNLVDALEFEIKL